MMALIKNSSLIVALISICLLSLSIETTAQRTTRKGIRVESKHENKSKEHNDTIAIDPSSNQIMIAGYDKPLRASKETFFVRNHTSNHIRGLRICFEYIDSKGRVLHKRECHITIDIPAGETRQAATPSWDIQKSFYYKFSNKPRKSDATPFDVKCKIISIDI